jgi:Ca2+-transporting ATPase
MTETEAGTPPTVWHALTVDEACAQLDTDAARGLNEDEAARRLVASGPNELPVTPARSTLSILLHQFKSLIVLLLIVATGIAFALGDSVEGIAILVVIILNAGIGFGIEWKAERTLSALQKQAVATARVVRQGTERQVESRALVPGDIVVVAAGARVPADGRLVASTELRVEEAALTGESQPVSKETAPVADAVAAIADRVDMVYMGTTVTDGHGRYVVTATGTQTEVGKVGTLIASAVTRATPLEGKLTKLSTWLIGVVFVLTGVIVLVGWLRGGAFLPVLEVGISLAIAAVPEGLAAVTTMTLAVGMQRMARMHALIRRLPAVETLGSTTVICTDKTGTLTRNEMTVRVVVVGERRVVVTGAGYGVTGSFEVDGTRLDPSTDEALATALRIGSLCNDAKLERREGDPTVLGDPTEGALIVLAEKAGLVHEELRARYPRVRDVPFSSETKRMVTVHRRPDGTHVAYVKGSPGAILDACALSPEERERLLAVNVALAGQALRVLALAYRELEGDGASEAFDHDLAFAGLVGMEDPVREEAKAAIATCLAAGIRTIMITGDQPATAAAIAEQLGLDHDAQGKSRASVHGRDLDGLDERGWQTIAASASVFARVTPEQKLRIVEALQRDGEVVAMTGDGVNDAPALKAADIGIAMGGTGTEVAKESSAMVITDDNFATIVGAVEQGRIIYANILRFIHYLFSCNTGEIMVVFVAVMIGWPMPLTALQILWLNMITDVFPAMALALEPSSPEIMREPPRDPSTAVVPVRMVGLIAWEGAVLAAATLVAFVLGLRWYGTAGDGLLIAQTMAFMTLATAQVFHAFSARSETRSAFGAGFFGNKWLWGAVAVCLALQAAAVLVPVLRRVLHTAPLGLVDWAVVLGCSLAPVVISELVKLVRR